MRIAIVAGEASGDLIGASLLQSLKSVHPEVKAFGIAGPEMEKAGCEVWYPASKLSVMGIVETLKHLPEIFSIRRQLYKRLLADPPDVFIGIDAPDFNLSLERKLRKRGVKTIHYVSPSVWAWRGHRIKKIREAVDRILVLFPFEVSFYRQHNVTARFVGHPLADALPHNPDKLPARKNLGLDEDSTVIALMPGSRRFEIEGLTPLFLQAASICDQKYPNLQFVIPLIDERLSAYIAEQIQQFATSTRITVVPGQSHSVMQAADFILLASGTAALEAMLLGRPMVVCYKLSRFTYWYAMRSMQVSEFSLPNLLAGKKVVEELIQDDANAENMAAALIRLLENPDQVRDLLRLFGELYLDLKKNASQQAASAVLELESESHDKTV